MLFSFMAADGSATMKAVEKESEMLHGQKTMRKRLRHSVAWRETAKRMLDVADLHTPLRQAKESVLTKSGFFALDLE